MVVARDYSGLIVGGKNIQVNAELFADDLLEHKIRLGPLGEIAPEISESCSLSNDAWCDCRRRMLLLASSS